MNEVRNQLIGLFILSLLILGGFYLILSTKNYSGSTGQPININSQKPEARIITVSGEGRISVAPNKVVTVIQIETKDLTVPVSQQKNAEIVSGVRKELLKQGLEEKQIQTTSYDLHAVNRCEMVCTLTNPTCNPWEKVCNSIFEGYLTLHTISFESYDVNNVGKLLDSVILAGATRINSVTLTLKDETKKELKKQLLAEAGQEAKEKAGILASSTDSRLGQLHSLSESVSFPVRDYYGMTGGSVASLGSLGASYAQTTVSTGELDVTATITASFEVE